MGPLFYGKTMNKKIQFYVRDTSHTMKPKFILNLLWGLLWTYCLIVPYGLVVAWGGFSFCENRPPSVWELFLWTLAVSLNVMAVQWYFTFPLAAAIGWCLYLRRQLKTKSATKP